MTLVFDNRAILQGQPGLDALIIGISAYRYLPKEDEPVTPSSFGMRQVSSAALTTYKIYHWLIERQNYFSVPLKTCRLLLSPSLSEIAIEPNLSDLASPCTLNRFLEVAAEWRVDASSHQGNITFFYFVGWGLQRRVGDSDVILLLEDFADGIGGTLKNAIDMNNFFNGMARSKERQDMARTQLYFVDASRHIPSKKNFERMNTTDVWDIELSGSDARCAPIFYASTPGGHSYGIKGEQSLFSKALLHCLNGAAGVLKEVDGQEKWCVTVNSLSEALTTSLDDVLKAFDAVGLQDFTVGGLARDAIIHFLNTPSSVIKLVFDKRIELQGQPGLHALICGISGYRYLPKENEPLTPESFGMHQLSSAALTAYKVYRWLLDHQQNFSAPLATCRLLLSSSLTEIAVEPNLRSLGNRCTLDKFLAAATDWRTDASSHRDNITFFYFAGHGVQRSKDDAVLLLEDFADGIGGTLTNAVDVKNLFNGMAPSTSRLGMAGTQLYFIDSCRNLPSRFKAFERMEVTPAFDVELSGRDDRRAPIFFAAIPGSKAYGLAGEQTLFSKALIECLNGAAAEPGKANENGQVKRYVSVTSLSKTLDEYILKLNQAEGADQDFTVGGLAKEAIILEISPSDPIPKEGSM